MGYGINRCFKDGYFVAIRVIRGQHKAVCLIASLYILFEIAGYSAQGGIPGFSAFVTPYKTAVMKSFDLIQISAIDTV
jgi:hypothetical protein